MFVVELMIYRVEVGTVLPLSESVRVKALSYLVRNL